MVCDDLQGSIFHFEGVVQAVPVFVDDPAEAVALFTAGSPKFADIFLLQLVGVTGELAVLVLDQNQAAIA